MKGFKLLMLLIDALKILEPVLDKLLDLFDQFRAGGE